MIGKILGFPGGSDGKCRDWVWSLGQEDPLESRMDTHSSIASGIPWTEEPGSSSLQSQTWLSD